MGEPFEGPIQCCAPTGKWRVVETSFLENRYIRLIGDFDSFTDASTAIRNARFPYQFVLYNDLGQKVMALAPPDDAGGPLCGPES